MISLAAFVGWVFLLLMAIVGLLKLLANKAGSLSSSSDSDSTSTTPTRPADSPRPARRSDEEEIRKFLEALGQSPGSKAPPPVVPRTDIPPRPLAPVQPPPSMFSPMPGLPKRGRTVFTPQKPVPDPGDWLRKINRSAPPVEQERQRVSPTVRVEPEAFEIRESSIGPPPQLRTPAEAYAIATGATPTREKAQSDLTTLLRSPSGLRNAIILREIFGPPRSLQPLEEIAGFA
jgi:hypothetical protein